MPDLFLYRSCDVTVSGAREALKRNVDVADRAIALLEAPTGLPPDEAVPSDAGAANPPTVDIIGASWCSVSNTGRGSLAPKVYNYRLIPIDTCTGRTGVPIPIPSLTVDTLGQEATLCVSVGEKPDPCLSLLVERDGVIVGRPRPVADQILDSFPVTTAANVDGTFEDGTANTFKIVSGADLVAGDAVLYQGTPTVVTGVSAGVVSINPPVPLDLPPPPAGYFDIAQRTNLYVPLLNPAPLAFPIPIAPVPLFTFRVLVTSPPVYTPQLGDIMQYGSSTAIVVSTSQPPLSAERDVMVVPFGLLPIPPLPAGVIRLVWRPLNVPSFGNGIGAYTNGFGATFETALADPTLSAGATVAYGGELCRILSVVPSGLGQLVTIETPVTNVLAIGAYFVLPEGLSQFVTPSSITATGAYQRLSRLTTTTVSSGLWQVNETGSDQTRSGDVSGGAELRTILDSTFTRSGYQGLDTLLRRLRGPSSSAVDRSFNRYNGALILLGNRLYAVNDFANLGSDTPIDLTYTRAVRDTLGTSAAVNDVQTALNTYGIAVVRYESQTVTIPPAACPPGDQPVTETRLVYRGVVTATNVVKGTDVLDAYVSPSTTVAGRTLLGKAGMTSTEVTDAVNRTASGRVRTVTVQTTTQASDTANLLNHFTTTQLDALVTTTRVERIGLSTLTRTQVSRILGLRGHAGVIQRVPGTETTTASEPGYQTIDDLTLHATNLLADLLRYNESFDVCDFDAALASVPAGAARNALAAVLAIVDSGMLLLQKAGIALARFLDDEDFRGAVDAIGGIITAIAADPTLGCLVGPINQQTDEFSIPGIPQLELGMRDLAFPLQTRFELTQLFVLAIQTLVCAITNALVKLLPADASAFTQRVIGCLPDFDVAVASLPIDVDIVLSCNLERLYIIGDLLQEVTSEANEFIAFLNGFGQGFIFRNVHARNTACSGDQSFADVAGAAANQFGINNLIGQARVLASALDGVA